MNTSLFMAVFKFCDMGYEFTIIKIVSPTIVTISTLAISRPRLGGVALITGNFYPLNETLLMF